MNVYGKKLVEAVLGTVKALCETSETRTTPFVDIMKSLKEQEPALEGREGTIKDIVKFELASEVAIWAGRYGGHYIIGNEPVALTKEAPRCSDEFAAKLTEALSVVFKSLKECQTGTLVVRQFQILDLEEMPAAIEQVESAIRTDERFTSNYHVRDGNIKQGPLPARKPRTPRVTAATSLEPTAAPAEAPAA